MVVWFVGCWIRQKARLRAEKMLVPKFTQTGIVTWGFHGIKHEELPEGCSWARKQVGKSICSYIYVWIAAVCLQWCLCEGLVIHFLFPDFATIYRNGHSINPVSRTPKVISSLEVPEKLKKPILVASEYSGIRFLLLWVVVRHSSVFCNSLLSTLSIVLARLSSSAWDESNSRLNLFLILTFNVLMMDPFSLVLKIVWVCASDFELGHNPRSFANY